MIRTWTHRRYRPPRTCDPRDVEAPACARSTLLRGCGDGVRARGVCRVHVHKRNVAVCVRVRGANGDRAQHVRAFGTTTAELLNTSGLARDARRHARSSGEHRRVLAPRLQSPYRSHTVGAGVRRARRQGPRRRERSPASKEAVANPAITAVILGQARAQRQAASSPSAAALRSRSGANGGVGPAPRRDVQAGGRMPAATSSSEGGRSVAPAGCRVPLTGFRRCVFAVCLCGEALDVAPQLPDNFRADGNTRNGASRRRDECRARIRRDGDCPASRPSDAERGLAARSLLDDPTGTGLAELPRRSRGSGGRALAKPRFLEGASTSVAARSIRWVVMQPGGADVAARSSSSMPLAVDYRAILEEEGRTGIRAVARVP